MERLILDPCTGEFVPDNSDILHDHDEASICFEDVLDEETGQFRRVAITTVPENLDMVKKPTKQRQNTRKRVRQQDKWVRNVRKSKHQSGQEYTSVRGKTIPAKKVETKKDCFSSCLFKCSRNIDDATREQIHKKFYELDQNQKYHFILNTTEKKEKKRSTCQSNLKKYTYFFYFNVEEKFIKVCKTFYLSTLSISQKSVYGVHKKKDILTGVPANDSRGKHKNHRRVSEERKQLVREHITSFPAIESHYCRASSKRIYLESQLSLNKMYDLYKESCKNNSSEPVKKSMYSKIFNEEYNIAFHVPKKDRCDVCEEWKILEKENRGSVELKEKYESHIKEKEAMRLERKKDRESQAPVLCFDLENIITCPRAEISCFFYHSKLNVYNLTGHFSRNKQVYCSVWNETLAGKSGNDIASGLQAILTTVFADNPDLKHLTLWCDSCVPQNRNSLMSYAILDFLKRNEHIEYIEVKYSTPGHSGVQEIDNVHSRIEHVLSTAEFYSPVSLMKLLKKVDSKKPFKIVQMTNSDVLDYASCSKTLDYVQIPYTKVTSLKFTQCYFTVLYKTSHTMTEWLRANLIKHPARASKRQNNRISFPRDLPEPKPLTERKKLAPNKIKSLKAMMKWMPKVDLEYFQALLRTVE